MSDSDDFDVLKTLWSKVNEVCVPPPPPGEQPKALFLMEMPGFSVDPDAYDPTKFNPGNMMSPECAAASLCDRVPALASYFYDTGNHISFYWKLLLQTFTIEGEFEKKNADIEARYQKAIQMLYGSEDGYVKQEKTQLFKNLEVLRKNWDTTVHALKDYKTECQTGSDKKNWPGNYETQAAPLVDAVEQAFTEYNNLRLQIEKYESAIFAYSTGDLNTVLLEQENSKICIRPCVSKVGGRARDK